MTWREIAELFARPRCDCRDAGGAFQSLIVREFENAQRRMAEEEAMQKSLGIGTIEVRQDVEIDG